MTGRNFTRQGQTARAAFIDLVFRSSLLRQNHQLLETRVTMKRFKIRVCFHAQKGTRRQAMLDRVPQMPERGLRLAGNGLDAGKVIHRQSGGWGIRTLTAGFPFDHFTF